MIKWHSCNGAIKIKDLTDFDPIHTFDCGQCFRWTRLENGNWRGIVRGIPVEVSWDGRDLTFYDTTEEIFLKVWYPYFDLGRDYGEIKRILTADDPVMARAIAFGEGMRLLRQDFDETLISFIISQNNGIPRIKKIIESLCTHFGEPIQYHDNTCYTIPSMARLGGLTDEEIRAVRAGYRDKYILKAARQMTDKLVDSCLLESCSTNEARKAILQLSGVGPKVCDCILLFAGIKYDVFPVDRWVSRVMAELYLGYEAGYDELTEYARERFGPLAGFAQQYLFYYARAHKIGI